MRSARRQSSYEAAITLTVSAAQGGALQARGSGERARSRPAPVAMGNERAAEQNGGQKGGSPNMAPQKNWQEKW